MDDTDFCILCGETIGMFDKKCKYCGENQFGENNEFYPDEKAMRKAQKMLKATTPKRAKKQGLSVEEQFFAGIHPNDEMYRKTLELEILSKNYKNK